MSTTAVKNEQMAICTETMGYDEYPVASWHKGEEYGYSDNGHTLTIASETGNFYFKGEARKYMKKSFNID